MQATFKRCGCNLVDGELVDACGQPCAHFLKETEIRKEVVNYGAQHDELGEKDVVCLTEYLSPYGRKTARDMLRNVSCFTVVEEKDGVKKQKTFDVTFTKQDTLYGLVPIAALGEGLATEVFDQPHYQEAADAMFENMANREMKRWEQVANQCPERLEAGVVCFVKSFMQASMTRCDCEAPTTVALPDTTQLRNGGCPHSWRLRAIAKEMGQFADKSPGDSREYGKLILGRAPTSARSLENVKRGITQVQGYTVGARLLTLRFQEFGGTGLELQGFLPPKKRKR